MIYPWIWRHLPGPTWLKALESAALVAAVVAVLFMLVFPWLETRSGINDVTVDASSPVPLGTDRGL